MIIITNQQGRILELKSDTVIAVERNNSLFSTEDEFFHDVTYPGQTGLTESNKEFIKGGHLVEAKNAVYEQTVQMAVSGYDFYSAIFSYRIVKDNIEYVLKVNFGAVVAKLKAAKLPDIYTLDPIIKSSNTEREAYMKATCTAPKNYPCAFFPVYNELWNPAAAEGDSKWLNNWDHGLQKFVIPGGGTRPAASGVVPYFKVIYILQKIFDYLNLKMTGGYVDDPRSHELYIYTRRTAGGNVLPSMSFMPNMSANDFLKQLTERLKIAFTFDLLNGTVKVETPFSTLSSQKCFDITNYIESVDEKSIPDQKGYTVTLKIDETDEALNRGTEDETNYTAAFSMVIGLGETKTEMAIGTLSTHIGEEYSYPVSKQTFNTTDQSDFTDWPLRLIQFKGMKSLGNGKVFPEATSFELTEADATWYRFLNDSKKVLISAKIPPAELAKIDPTEKIACVTANGGNFYALPVKITYNLTNNILERIPVKIEARTIVTDFATKVYFNNEDPIDATTRLLIKYKAFYNPDLQGFKSIRIERVPLPGSAAVFGFTEIDSPTDDGGVGGTIGTTFRISGSRADTTNAQTRLYSSVAPKFYVQYGAKGYFTQVGNYYTFNALPSQNIIGGDKPIWIVF